MGAYPPGLDGGNWLLMGRRLFGVGAEAIGYPAHVYPPLIPVMMFGLSLVAGVPVGAKLLAVGSVAAVMAAVLWIARKALSPGVALGIAFLTGASFAVVEPAAFGGYPQNFAFAAGLVALEALASYLQTGGAKPLATATLFLFIAGLAHHAYFILVCAASLTLIALAHLLVRDMKDRVARTVRGLLALLPGAVPFAFTARAMIQAGYTPPVNAPQFTHGNAFFHVFREPHIFWYAVLGLGFLRLLAIRADQRRALDLAALALGITGGCAFIYAAEARLLPPVMVAAALGFGFLLDDSKDRPRARLASTAIGAGLLLWIAPSLDTQAKGVIGWFQYMDEDYVEAATWIHGHSPRGLVAVAADDRGYPLGWWLAGMADARVIAGSDPRWLAFPKQRDLAESIGRVFDDRLLWFEASKVARVEGIDFVVAPKRFWTHWQAWVFEEGVNVAFENGSWVVFDARLKQP
jgi:hypothetical protein